MVALHDHNERARGAELVERALAGATVLVVSDAGMPTVSDPGYGIVRAAIDAGVQVTTLPGPSAVLAALAVSGLATDRFAFRGLSSSQTGRESGGRRALASEQRTLLFFESPRRVGAFLADLRDGFGEDRLAAVCRELTKTHEEVVRGTLRELAAWAAQRDVLGEVVVVVAGRSADAPSNAVLVAEVLERVAAGERLKDACKAVAAAGGVPQRELYAAALAAKGSA